MKQVRWGIIGIGRFGRVHAQVIRSLKGSRLLAVCARREQQLHCIADELQVERRYTDYRQLLDDPEVDAVSITTHWRQHAEVAEAALLSGKHVLLEKPMAAGASECGRLLELSERATGFLMVGHVCRFDPRVTLGLEAIRSGRLGRIISMHARRNLPRAPGSIRLDKISPLMGDGIHDADLMMWFLGTAPSRVYARNLRVGQYEFPDLGWAMFEFGDQAIGVIETNWCLPENVPTTIDARLEVIGTLGKMTVDCGHAGLEILDAAGLHYPDTAYWPRQHGRLVGALSAELDYFADCIRAGRAPEVITPAEAARAVAVMEAAELSAERGEPVEIDAGAE